MCVCDIWHSGRRAGLWEYVILSHAVYRSELSDRDSARRGSWHRSECVLVERLAAWVARRLCVFP